MKTKWYRKVEWTSVLFLSLTPILGIALAAYYIINHGFSWQLFLLSVFFYYATGMSITGGYHRLFSHRTYQANLFVRVMYLFFGAGAFQNSVVIWCTDHRYHHKYTDTPMDPYNAKRGFWYSHIGWMFLKESPVEDRVANLLTRDLQKDPWVKFQHDYYIPIAILASFITPALMGWTFGAPFGAFIFAGVLRMVFVHHYTFLINSLAHIWGKQTYGQKYTAKDNAILSFFTYGEGYHNFHHHFQNDYRNGIRWYDFDPTKWLINIASYFGMTSKLKITPESEIILAQVDQQSRSFQSMKTDLVEPFHPRMEQLKDKVDQCAAQLKALQDDYRRLALELKSKKDLRLSLLKREIKVAQRDLRLRYYHWKIFLTQLEKAGFQVLPS